MDTASTASDDVPWGEPFDGLACRLVVQPRYAVGQAIDAVVEVKNTSKKTRYFVPNLDPSVIEFLTFELAGPKGKVEQTYLNRTKQQYIHEHQFQPIGPGEVKRFAMIDLRDYYLALNESWPGAPSGSIGKVVVPGKYTLLARFRSPKVPSRFVVGWSNENGKQITKYKDVPAEVTAGQWAGELSVAPVTFELAPLAKEDFVVHEWGVFTVFNDAEFANIDRKDEWGNLPSFFYRQFPTALGAVRMGQAGDLFLRQAESDSAQR